MAISRRITSFVLSAVMLAGNIVSPLAAYAGEADTGSGRVMQTEADPDYAGADAAADAPDGGNPAGPGEQVAEARDYRVVLQETDAFGLSYDQAHFSSEDKKKKKVTLLYKAGEEVDIDLYKCDGYEIDKLYFADKEQIDPEKDKPDITYKELDYTWKDEDTITLTMPESDVWMQSEYHHIQTDPQAQ